MADDAIYFTGNVVPKPEFKRIDARIKFERIRDAVLPPKKAYESDAGWDLYANETKMIYPGKLETLKLGLIIELPLDWEAQIRLRSSMVKRGLLIPHGIGTIDAGYRGELLLPVVNRINRPVVIDKTDRVGQILFKRVPYVIFEEAKVNIDTDRGSGGFGSSGQ